MQAVARTAMADAVRRAATATAISPAAAAGTIAAVKKGGATSAAAVLTTFLRKGQCRAAAVAKKEGCKASKLHGVKKNIRGQAADEQMVQIYRIECADPGMQQEKESDEEREHCNRPFS